MKIGNKKSYWVTKSRFNPRFRLIELKIMESGFAVLQAV